MKKIVMAVSLIFGLSAFADSIIFDADFSTFTDGALNGQGSWQGQNALQISGGNLIVSNSFSRGKRFGNMAPVVGEQIRITLTDVSHNTGSGDFRIGVANSPEHTGAETPQLFGFLEFSGGSASIGGISDSGYNANDLLNIQLSFTRLAGSGWSLHTTLENTTDASAQLLNTSTPVDTLGVTGTSAGVTTWDYVNAGSNLHFGVRGLSANTGDELSIGAIRVDLISAVPEPSSLALLGLGFAVMFTARRRKS